MLSKTWKIDRFLCFFLLIFLEIKNGVSFRHYEAQTAGTKHTCFLQKVDNFASKTCIFDRFCSVKKRIKTHYFHENIDVKTISKVHISVQKHIFRSQTFIFNFFKNFFILFLLKFVLFFLKK